MGLVVCACGELAVLCGHVESIRNDTLVLRDDIRVEIVYKPGYIQKMNVRIGSELVTVVKNTLELDIIADGGTMRTKLYRTEGFIIKYGGEMVVENQRIIFGTVAAAFVRHTKAGDIVNYDVVSGNKEHRKKYRVLTDEPALVHGAVGRKLIGFSDAYYYKVKIV